MNKPQVSLMDDGSRLHLHHGPIDLILEAFGEEDRIKLAYQNVETEFQSLLQNLVKELPVLRRPIKDKEKKPICPVGQRMHDAVLPFSSSFITPMAAVAGSVADHILNCLCKDHRFGKAYVNNGGDIALYLDEDETFDIGIVETSAIPQKTGHITVSGKDNIHGIATSGMHGRSHSLGIADAVTVLAQTAAIADAAATLIANAVDIPGSPAIIRKPANELTPDTDLGSRLVTVGLKEIEQEEINEAVNRGLTVATKYQKRGLIKAAWISLRGTIKIVAPQNLLTQENRNSKHETFNNKLGRKQS